MAQSAFQADLDQFLQQTIDPEGESFQTKIDFVADGEYQAEITGLAPRKFQQEGEWRGLVEVTWSILDPNVKESMQLDDPRARQTIFLDLKKGWNGEGMFPLDIGRNKNTVLGRLLSALRMNDGKKFSWAKLMHEQAWVRVRKPRNEEQSLFADVVMVSSAKDGFPGATRKAA